MLPAAEDNYGSDACDIIALDSEPPVLVVSTLYGTLMHCILLDSSEPSNRTVSWYCNTLTLYVFPLYWILKIVFNTQICKSMSIYVQMQCV